MSPISIGYAASRRALQFGAAFSFIAAPLAAQSARSPLDGLDAYITAAMQTWKVPGLAIAVIRNDTVILSKGYGTRTVGATQPVDDHTLFAIGSSSKAFTAMLVAMMVDERKMGWNDPVTKHLPGFQMFDPYVTRELTIRDALTHRSGLARGDLVWYATELPRTEVLRRVRFIEPSWSVRAQFGYQNLMYLAAGEAVASVAGRSWDDLVRFRIFDQLGMTESNTSVKALAGKTNVASPHAEIRDTLRAVPYHNIDNVAPAGSINSTAADMIKWVRFQLASGKVGDKQLVTPAAFNVMHTPQMPVPVSAEARRVNPFTHLQSYGMGWFLQDYRGRQLDQHGGNIDGMSALVGLVPEEKTGLVILTNANSTPLPTIIMYRVLDALWSAAPRDWSTEYKTTADRQRATARLAAAGRAMLRVMNTSPSLALASYAGVYADSLYGDVALRLDAGKLVLKYGTLEGDLEHWHYDTFRIQYRGPMGGQTFATFSLGANARVARVNIEQFGSDFTRRVTAADTVARR